MTTTVFITYCKEISEKSTAIILLLLKDFGTFLFPKDSNLSTLFCNSTGDWFAL